MKKYLAEFIGTAALVFLGCGAVTLGGQGAALGSGGLGILATLPIALAFGLAVTAMAYGIGPVSGCHINPAVTAGVWASGRMPANEAVSYVVAQCLGAIFGAAVLYAILSGKTGGWNLATGGLGQNGYTAYSTGSAALAEFVGTFLFLVTILGATSKAGSGPAAGLAIGLTLAAIHIVLIPVTGTSVNPARSLGPALFVGGSALAQLWLFLVMPVLGGLAAGFLFRNKALEA
ncbi:MAG: MIP family channel protein [Beijerinckiaceae bacterium]